MDIKIQVPENLDLEQLKELYPYTNLPTKEKSAEYLYFICNTLVAYKAKRGGWVGKNNGFINLCAIYLRLIHADYRKYIEYLLQAGVLETDGIFQPELKCTGFKFTSLYEGQLLKEVEIKGYVLKKAIRKQKDHINEKHRQELKGYGHILKWYFSGKLKIDEEAATKWIDEFYSLNADAIATRINDRDTVKEDLNKLMDVCNSLRIYVAKIASGRFEYSDFTACKFGHRLHGIFTYMMKEIRHFITYDGKQLVNDDVGNSQPYFLSALMDANFWKSSKVKTKKVRLYQISQLIYEVMRENEHLYEGIMLQLSSENLIQQEVSCKHYNNLSAGGILYKYLEKKLPQLLPIGFLRKYGNRVADRDSIKREVLRIMYCLNERISLPYYEPCIAFRQLFPVVAQVLYLIKENEIIIEPELRRKEPIVKNKTLAAILQRIESHLILKVICRRIAKERPELPIFTIHDSIVTTVGDEEYVKQVINEVLTEKIGIPPTVKFEYWKQENAYPVPVNKYICPEEYENDELE